MKERYLSTEYIGEGGRTDLLALNLGCNQGEYIQCMECSALENTETLFLDISVECHDPQMGVKIKV